VAIGRCYPRDHPGDPVRAAGKQRVFRNPSLLITGRTTLPLPVEKP
jgi:hypothetical protein